MYLTEQQKANVLGKDYSSIKYPTCNLPVLSFCANWQYICAKKIFLNLHVCLLFVQVLSTLCKIINFLNLTLAGLNFMDLIYSF